MVNSNRLIIPVLAVLLCLWALGPAAGEDSRAIEAMKVVPDKKARSAIVALDGYAQLSEDKTINEVRSMAFTNAKRQALESANTYIQTKTKVKNFQLEYDLVKAEAAGYVTVLEQKDLGIEKNSRYHVWIRAEVKYELRPHAPISEMDPDAPLTVKVWTKKKTYRAGEMINILIHANRDFYGRVVNQTSTGQLIQLLPNEFRTQNFFRGGRTYSIPGPGDRFNLKVTPPFGREQILVYASETPTGDVTLHSVGAGLGSYRGTVKELSRGVRSITPMASGEGPFRAEFYEAEWHLVTEPWSAKTRPRRRVFESSAPKERSLKRVVPERPIDMTGTAGREDTESLPESEAR